MEFQGTAWRRDTSTLILILQFTPKSVVAVVKNPGRFGLVFTLTIPRARLHDVHNTCTYIYTYLRIRYMYVRVRNGEGPSLCRSTEIHKMQGLSFVPSEGHMNNNLFYNTNSILYIFTQI